MNSTLKKTRLFFNEGILRVQFLENAAVEVEDVIYIYCYGRDKSKGNAYAVLFNSTSEHEFSEDAIVYFADTCHTQNVMAIAYISETLISKIRLSLLMIFERPILKPKIFSDEKLAYQWLQEQVRQKGLSIVG